MKKYFIHDGQKQLGPFSANELIERGISACTPIYTLGLGRYVIAAEIPVLNDALLGNNNGASLNNKLQNHNTFVKRMAWLVGVMLIIIVPLVVYKIQMDVPDVSSGNVNIAPLAKKEGIVSNSFVAQKETANPVSYLIVHGKMHKNLIGKKIIKGSITSLASLVTYKNMEMAITFLSADQTELQTQQFYVNDIVSPNNVITFRNVFNAPSATEGFKVKVLSAIATP